MANQITDNRTVVASFNTASPGTVDLTGASAGTQDTEIKLEGASSVGQYTTSSIDGLLYDYGTAQNLASNVFYIWINCGIVGLLDTKALGGMRIRFAGATVTDWFEVYVAGSDSWPAAVQGGWTQFVVDIETARSTAVTNGWTNGTTPATSAIRYVGYAAITSGTMPRMVDNTWMDEIRRLPDGTAGILIEGRNAGTTDWSSADIYAQLGDAAGTFVPSAGGAWKVNTPIQFGINDTSTHAFTDTSSVWLWDDQEYLPDDVYKISALGNSGGTTNVTMGIKSGTGDDATGSQGITISAASAGARWSMDFNDPNIDGANFYGCNFIHGGDFLFDDPAVSVISSFYIDCSSALVSNSEQLRVSVVNANTANGVAFMTTDDMGDIVYSSFSFSDGHAVELTTPRIASQTSKGNLFSGYGATASNDAAVYNNTAGAVTLTVTSLGDSPTYRDGTSASTTIVAGSVTVDVSSVDSGGNNVNDAIFHIEATGTTKSPFPVADTVTIVNSGTTATVTHTGHGMATNDKVVIRGASLNANLGVFLITVTDVNTYTYTMGSTPGSSPTGTITSTFVVLNGLPTAGQNTITMSRVFSSNQLVTGSARKSSSAPYYKAAPINGTVSSTLGASFTATMISDD